jgi:molybdopterin-guanine dinucleotide biosynthesis protein A
MGGGDKGLLPLGDGTILDQVIGRLGPQVGGMALNANGNPARFAGLGLPVVPDAGDDRPGPLAGVLAGLDWAAGQGAGAIVTAAADTPFLPQDLVARLQAAARAADLACASSNGRTNPVFGLWPVRLAEELRHAMVEEQIRKVDVWTARYELAVVDFPATPFDPFFNTNRPEDLAEAERLLRDRAST